MIGWLDVQSADSAVVPLDEMILVLGVSAKLLKFDLRPAELGLSNISSVGVYPANSAVALVST